MNELVRLLIRDAGLNEDQARQVVGVLKDNVDKLPRWIVETLAAKRPAGARHGGMLGG
jgi:hypothetical protein